MVVVVWATGATNSVVVVVEEEPAGRMAPVVYFSVLTNPVETFSGATISLDFW